MSGEKRRLTFGRHPSTLIALTLLIVAGLIAAIVPLALSIEWGPTFSVSGVKHTIQAWGAWGIVASLMLMVIHSFLPFPAEIVAMANGMIYGPLWGTVITWTGAMLGAYTAFGLARVLGRPFVEHVVARRHWRHLDHWTALHGGLLIFVCRFLPFIAFNLINYAVGLTRVSWWTFSWSTGLGILPLTTVMVVLGDSAESMPWDIWLLVAAGGVAFFLIFRREIRRQVDRVVCRFEKRPSHDDTQP